MADQLERKMAETIWQFFNKHLNVELREAALAALLGAPPATKLHCWRGPSPGADLLFGNPQDILQAVVELKRTTTPSQYSSVRHVLGAFPFTAASGKVDPLAAEVLAVARSRIPHEHPVLDDQCGDVDHTQKGRDAAGGYVWSCAVPQIDLYRGCVLLPTDASGAALKPQDPRNVRWVFIAENGQPLTERYPGSITASCWVLRTWSEVTGDLRSAAATLGAAGAPAQALATELDALR